MKPQVIFLVGPPLSGKDTFLKSGNYQDYDIISRDDILMSLHVNDDYNEAFKTVNQKNVDKLLNHKIMKSITNKRNVIVNLTNLTVKSRNKNLCKFDSNVYDKVAYVFPKLTLDEYEQRNKYRKTKENKFISFDVIIDMINKWEKVTLEEGFNTIVYL